MVLTGKAVHVITERQKALLDFERTWWAQDRPKDLVIRERFGCSPQEYSSELNEVLELPEAREYDPLLVRRLERRRLRRHRDRRDPVEANGGAQV
jgi:hypothetical protein